VELDASGVLLRLPMMLLADMVVFARGDPGIFQSARSVRAVGGGGEVSGGDSRLRNVEGTCSACCPQRYSTMECVYVSGSIRLHYSTRTRSRLSVGVTW